jgi:hypothetical protein
MPFDCQHLSMCLGTYSRIAHPYDQPTDSRLHQPDPSLPDLQRVLVPPVSYRQPQSPSPALMLATINGACTCRSRRAARPMEPQVSVAVVESLPSCPPSVKVRIK